MMRAFDDYQDDCRAGAVVEAADFAELAAATKLPLAALEQTVASVRRCVEGEESDPFGRDFTGHPPLEPPYRAARVTGALFHTQAGLCIDMAARVLRRDGLPLPICSRAAAPLAAYPADVTRPSRNSRH